MGIVNVVIYCVGVHGTEALGYAGIFFLCFRGAFGEFFIKISYLIFVFSEKFDICFLLFFCLLVWQLFLSVVWRFLCQGGAQSSGGCM